MFMRSVALVALAAGVLALGPGVASAQHGGHGLGVAGHGVYGLGAHGGFGHTYGGVLSVYLVYPVYPVYPTMITPNMFPLPYGSIAGWGNYGWVDLDMGWSNMGGWVDVDRGWSNLGGW
jgi:hypothetical protein